MEKDPLTAKPRASRPPAACSAAASDSVASTSAHVGQAARAVKSKPGLKSEPKTAPKLKRQRQRAESRAEMLERLSNPLISLHEASVLLRVCSATVRRLADAGELAHQRTVGGQRRFRLLDVLDVSAERDGRRDAAIRASLDAARRFGRRPPLTSVRSAVPALPLASARARSAQDLLDATRARAQAAQTQIVQARNATLERESVPPAASGSTEQRGVRLPLRLGAVRARAAATRARDEKGGEDDTGKAKRRG